MSTDHGIGKDIALSIDGMRAELQDDAAREEQLSLLEPLTSEEMLDARADLGGNAPHLAVVRHAREKRRGRPAGARNRRTDDLAAYLSQFGPDPAVAAMQIIATPEELMMQQSKDAGDGMHSWMTFTQARGVRMRMIELMMPYFHGKKPVQVDVSFAGIGDLVIEGETAAAYDEASVEDAEFLPVDRDREAGE